MLPQVHDITTVGKILEMKVSTPKDPKKGASAVIFVQWGPGREQSGGAVEFINAGYIRVPNYLYPKLDGKLKEGQMVKITGHLQGVLKQEMGTKFTQTENVADRVFILEGQENAQPVQVHEVSIVGKILEMKVSTPKDPKKGASAVIFVQWGPGREQSGGAVEFINAGYVRVPNYLYPKLEGKLKEGQVVKITGHLQGVLKQEMGTKFTQTENVADRVFILEGHPDAQVAVAQPQAEQPAT